MDRIVFLGHTRPHGQAGRHFQFQPQGDAQKEGVPQDGVVTVLGEVAGNLHRVGAEADAHFLAFAQAVRREFQFAVARHAILYLGFEHVHDADEAGDEFVDRPLIDFAGGADLFKVATGENGDALGDFHGLLLIVRDEDGGDVQIVVQADQPFAEFLPDFGVHRAERFVEQQDVRLGGEGAGDGHALALPAGELVRMPLFQALEAEKFEQFLDTRFAIFALPVFDFQAEGDVIEDGHALEEGVVLEHEPDVALLHGHIVDLLAMDEDVAFGGRFQTGDHAQNGGLAAAAGAEQRHEFAVFDFKIDLADGGDVAKAFADVFKLDAHVALWRCNQ